MHFNPVLSRMELKADYLSGEACNQKATHRNSPNGNDMQHTSSETSNLLSACSSHDSFSENAESKANLRISDSSEGISMLLKVDGGRATAEDQAHLESEVLCGNRFLSNQQEKQNDSECKGDDISCVSGADNPNMMDGNHSDERERKNVSCSSVSIDSSLLEGSSEAVNVQLASYRVAGGHSEVEDGCNCSYRPVKFLKVSLQESCPFSDKSDAFEISSATDVYAGASALKGEISECSMDQVESSYMRLASVTVEDHKHAALDTAESVKFKFEEDLATKAVKYSDQDEDFALLEVPNVQEPHDGSDLVEDVKVCDICGDAGRENLLAICSKCSDGAEHIYCMRIKLDKVPEGDWMCEECMLLEEIEKRKQDEIQKVMGNSKGSSLDEICQNDGISSTANIMTCMDLDIEKSRREKASSVPKFSAKRPADNLVDLSVTKRKALETSAGLPLLSQDSPLKLTQDTLCKSNSFNISVSKLKVQPREDLLQKQKFSRETAFSDKKEDDTVKMISKSLSFNSVGSGRPNMADSKIKIFSSSFSQVEDSKILRHTRGNNSIKRKYTSKCDQRRVGSPMAGPSVSASKNGRRIASDGDPSLVHDSGNKSLNQKDVQCSRNSSDSPKPANLQAHDDSKYHDDPTGTGVIKRRWRPCFSDVVRDPSSCTTSDSSHNIKPKANLSSSSALRTSRYCGSTGAIFSVSRELFSQDERAQEASSFGWAGEQISSGSKFVDRHKCSDAGHAAESCPIISTRTSFLGGSSQADTDHGNRMDLDPRFCNQPDVPRICAVPSLDFIWKGGFEMQSSGKLPSFCYGIQAHLCTRASPKVPEVVKKFPRKVLLEEVPRLSTWPTQFLETNPKEDSIGLYFFAEDFESYGENYKSLLECMIDYDLALKGNIDGIELLIFASNLLPEKSQRWNRLFFLWGVFRGRRVNNIECTPSFQKKASIPCLNNVLPDQDLSIPAVSGFENTYSSGPSRECLSASKLYYNGQQSSNYVNPLESPSVSSRRKDENCELKPSCPEQEYFGLQTNMDQKLSRDDTISLSIITMRKEQLLRDMEHTSTSLKEDGVPERKQEAGCQCHLQEISKCDMDCVKWRGGGAYNMKMTENSGTTDKCPFSTGSVPANGVLGVESSQWQLCSSDTEDHRDPGCLDLDLSIGAAKRSAKQGPLPIFLGIVKGENNQVKNPNTVASSINNNGGIDEFSASLDLSLGLPSYNK